MKTRAKLEEIALVEADVARLKKKVAKRVTTIKYTITSRRGVGTTGRPIQLLSNHFKVHVDNPDAVFYQYSVCLSCFFFQFT